MWAIEGGDVLFEWGWERRGVVYIEGGRVAAIGGGKAEGCPAVSVDGLFVVPGFIDLHVHGGGGASVWDATTEAVETMLKSHAAYGTTAMLVTTYPADEEHLVEQVRAVKAERPEGGAQPLGIHLEGPHLNAARTQGLAPPERLRPLSPNELARLAEAANVPIRLITLAPEVEGSLELIKAARAIGALCAISHTEATYEQTMEAIDAGCSDATHIFNTFAFASNARSPTALHACLLDDRVRAHLIADMLHVHPAFVRLLLRVKGWEKTVLITDALREAATEDAPKIVRANNGRILGSTLTTSRAVACMVKHAGVPLEAAVRMASYVPAKALELKKGIIKPGWDADIVVLDKNISVKMVVVEGVVVFADGILVKSVPAEV